MNKTKKPYYRVKCEEYPGGMIFERKPDALELSSECRFYGEKVYVRKISLTEEEFNSYPEAE